MLQRFNSKDVFKLLRIKSGAPTLPLTIEREVFIPGGRLDLVIRAGEDVLIVIEVKLASAATASLDTLKLYCDWMKLQAAQFKRCILLAVDANEADYECFAPLLWADLCINIRRMLPDIGERPRLVEAVMFVAFVSAVEQNLLHLARPDERQFGRSLMYARTADHIAAYLIGKSLTP